MLEFLPGERLKFVTVTIVDNPVPELDKIFRVELYNAEGGGEEFEPLSSNVSKINQKPCIMYPIWS